MAKKRLRRRASNDGPLARVNVLCRKKDEPGFTVVRHVFLDEAFRKIALREWTAIWYDNGELAGVLLSPPDRRRGERVRIRCGSVECLRGWVLGAQRVKVAKSKSAKLSFLRVLIDFFDVDRGERLKRVSAELALRKIETGHWKAIWGENGELAGVTVA